MATTDQTFAALARMRIELDQQVASTTRNLAAAWSRAWQEVADEWRLAIEDLLELGAGEWPTPTQVRRAQRAANAIKIADEALADLSRNAGVRIIRDTAMLLNGVNQWQRVLADSQLPSPQDAWTRVSREALDAIVNRTTRRVTALTRPLNQQATAAMKSTLIRGIAVGDNPTVAAREMMRRVNGNFEGGRRRAETIARTEMLDAHRAASQASRKANTDVVKGWRWACSLSPRTCPACLEQHGSFHAPEDPGPLGHPNCRCTTVPVTKTWKDLGIDLPEPPDTFPDAKQWFDSQDAETQQRIFGKERLRQYKAGDRNWGDFSQIRSNPGWRDSVQVKPLKV